tara:strand:+ start:807 stop:908 length:102 start_codon:yes stop_codon:yes gene_type:complete
MKQVREKRQQVREKRQQALLLIPVYPWVRFSDQ